METPPRRQHKPELQEDGQPRRKYTEDEKKQLLANLDLEVKDRIRQFEAYLTHSLDAFKLRHENEVTRIPRAIRTLTVAEFADKYDGDVNRALQAITKARMEASGENITTDASARKRKWEASMDEQLEAESSRAIKNARVASPQKKEVAGARPRLVKTPGARLRRPPSPGPSNQKLSSSKPKSSTSPAKGHHRVPTAASFNPALPKTPAFPRRPRANESLLSTNGSPLANPYETAYLAGEGAGSPLRHGESPPKASGAGRRKLERQRSITVLRGATFAASQQPMGSQGSQPPASEVVLSIKVLTVDGLMLEFDPLVTSSGDIEMLEGVTGDAKKRAKEELQELSSLMAKLGKWRI